LWSVAQFCQDTYLPIARTDKKARTVDVEHGLYQLWVEPRIGDKALLLVSPMDIERIKKKMLDAGRSPRTVQYALAVIRQIFNRALATGHFDGALPSAHVRAPSINNRRTRFLSHDEADLLLDEIKAHSQQLQISRQSRCTVAQELQKSSHCGGKT
jgi:site-specific recombinase XerD